jgi:hypothetical protein
MFLRTTRRYDPEDGTHSRTREAPNSTSTFFSLTDRWLDVRVYPEGPAIGHLDTAGFEVFPAVNMESIMFWDVTPCSPVQAALLAASFFLISCIG